MPEPVDAWWARRRWSRGLDVPYPVGAYREAWASFPVLIRQYHPDLNRGITLTQVPPAADVLLTWQCDVGHVFVATPEEQRRRPGRERRRSSWCPDCADAAAPRTPVLPMADQVRWPGASPLVAGPVAGGSASGASGASGGSPSTAGGPTRPRRGARDGRPAVGGTARDRRGKDGTPSTVGPAERRGSPATATTPTRARRSPAVCAKTPDLPVGEPFASACAPPPASAVEERLRQDLAARLDHTRGLNAVRLARPFFEHLEAWPDIVLPELRVAIEYDSTGRHGLEHVGRREEADRRKDRALRASGWEVIRIRTGKLPPLGPYDLCVSGLTRGTVDQLLDRLREIRGPLFVDAYLRAAPPSAAAG
ncbi:zinc-ribbon domain-containing protein [Clavibacter michiganensis]|uniref:zinc-ribbon domain-containing protein n=2 Tax=Clavibacter michiganensis TaxID=28447 RepID=UPI0026DB1FD9|nr:zinc-ribbon domain-containing protein [Clavibacter michiganensis]MDO4082230.1 zinc-ribbon domain-containing protein [Clavibacter michiganensis]